MSAAEIKKLRTETKRFIDHADERALKMVHALLEADAENENDLLCITKEQIAILDERVELDKKGLLEYTSWEDARARIISK